MTNRKEEIRDENQQWLKNIRFIIYTHTFYQTIIMILAMVLFFKIILSK